MVGATDPWQPYYASHRPGLGALPTSPPNSGGAGSSADGSENPYAAPQLDKFLKRVVDARGQTLITVIPRNARTTLVCGQWPRNTATDIIRDELRQLSVADKGILRITSSGRVNSTSRRSKLMSTNTWEPKLLSQ